MDYIKGKKIYIVENHHEVLKAWETEKKCNLISFDFHTDTVQAFRNMAAESKWGTTHEYNKNKTIQQCKNGKLPIEECIAILNHDEHISFAIEAGIIKKAYVFNFSSTDIPIWHNENIFTSHLECLKENCSLYKDVDVCNNCPQYNKHYNDAALDSALAPHIEKFKANGLDLTKPYILDFDCDYFLTKKSLSFEQSDTIKELIKNAQIITIALERNCVSYLTEQRSIAKDNSTTSDYTYNALRELIKTCL